ncbi:signal transduction histidine kinase [Noviherbaspirillum humi]|uniref:Signal transduction histidine kinase n=1 Tax=Noviherbaspirillum humi TaxID=1688639 RepID=A0A239DUU0_9BURK|nr:cache domain-containing protein [Noviherbaspirillum humi]SNS36240.1 signal transduction histidine kinase [Noviherbaspirillum humi]
MTLRQKIILFAITPLVLSMVSIAIAVRHQANILAQQQRASVESAYLAIKETELRHYTALATQAIAHLYKSGRSDKATLEEAKRILAKLEFGEDGYFFLYDMAGNNLMHPRQPQLIGKNLWDMKDANGRLTIQNLISRAKSGGGFERYLWEKPSTGKIMPKLGYVVPLERWGWMLGTGLYLDDVDTAIGKIDAQISRNIQNTMLWIAGIAITGALLITMSGLVLNISEYRVADAKLKMLAQRVVRSQEEERARLARDLHDGISQCLVSIKLQVEAAIAKLNLAPANAANAQTALNRAAEQLNNVLGEVRRISHGLRPTLLDDMGLAAALDHLAQEFSEHASIPTAFKSQGSLEDLSDVGTTVLFRIAQESLTNIQRHAGAHHAQILIEGSAERVRMTISDDGAGFDLEHVTGHPKHGIGLRNMHERLEAVGGNLQLLSSGQGTQVIATLPKRLRAYV